jgi:hypothetical protein
MKNDGMVHGSTLTGVEVACSRSGRDREAAPMVWQDIRSTCIRLNTVSSLVTLGCGNYSVPVLGSGDSVVEWRWYGVLVRERTRWWLCTDSRLHDGQ